ncbi:oligosaccharide flippase family protein [Candidatus Woesearchaeota archaeon]|jgi:O-antigen/teichoic acid export membrane protein|nr:oligosaccharide flippase family protein [Candidatus Woesearchaeota archaeon]MBT4114142.1 oligosaccharide flippase family protein [Candidatus Woesearchaeota archaeon]MBT4248415.1 oligosaccharide flippase family protein [Candidatus Woesearchaeota archaeon]
MANLNALATKVFGKTGSIISTTFVIYFIATSVGLLTNIVIARFFGKEMFGVYSYFLSITNLIHIFASFGLANTIAKLTEKQLSRKLLAKILVYVIIASFVFSLVFYQIASYLDLNPALNFFFWLIFGYSLMISVFTILSGAIRRTERYEVSMRFLTFNRVLVFLFILIAILSKNFWLVLLSATVSMLLLVPFKLKLTRLSSQKANFKPLFKKSLPFFLALIGMHSIYYIDRISIKYVLNFSELGYYTGFSNYINILRVSAYVIPFVMITASARKDFNIIGSVKKLISFILPFALAIGLTAPYLVVFLFGSEFAKVDSFLIWSLVISSSLLVIYSLINSIYLGQVQETRRKVVILTFDAILAIVVNLALNIFLISKIGLAGAPIATITVLAIKILLNTYGLKTSIKAVQT